MGIDIYLYKFNGQDFNMSCKALDDHEHDVSEIRSQISSDFLNGRTYRDLTEEEYNTRKYMLSQVTNAYIEENNLPLIADAYGLSLDETKIEIDSKINPKHMFKIGYFRSSYNGSGINGILKDTIGTNLYEIFEVAGGYRVKPNWKSAKENLQSALSMMENDDGYQVMKCNTISKCSDATEALNLFRGELKTKTHIDSYSNGIGDFFIKEPLPVHGIIHGTSYDRPCTYIIYKNEEGRKWYLDAIKIMIETCDYVLKQDEHDRYYFNWSA